MVNVFQEEMKRLEANIDSLQHEKDQLHEKLVNAKSNPATAKWVIFARFAQAWKSHGIQPLTWKVMEFYVDLEKWHFAWKSHWKSVEVIEKFHVPW